MPERSKVRIFSPEEVDERRDLRNVLLFGIVAAVVFGALALVGVPAGVLKIPLLPNVLVVLAFLIVALAGLIGLWLNRPVRQVAWSALITWTIALTVAVHFTGGPQTPFPATYILIVAAASFLLGLPEAVGIALLGTFSYALVLFLEYYGVLEIVQIWNMPFEPRGRELLLIVNLLTVAVPALVTASLVGTLAARLRSTNVHLRESERLRESLTSMIVHDLRNPLTALLGGLDILRLTTAKHMDDEQKHLLENARRSGRTLLGMIEELLDLSKMEAGKLTLNIQPVDLRTLIAESLDLVRSLSEVEELEIQTMLLEDVKSVPCDKQLISRVIVNLFSNAVKYTPAGGTVSVSARRQGNVALFSITDTGPGIPPEYQQHIFEKFGQVAQNGSERRGTGLGLTFCKMAVEAHGGNIWLESEVGKGSTFYFTLPYTS